MRPIQVWPARGRSAGDSNKWSESPVLRIAFVCLVPLLIAACTAASFYKRPWLQIPDPEVNDADVAAANAAPSPLDDGWQLSTLQAEGIDARPIAVLLKRVETGSYVGINGLVLARNGKLVGEHYFGATFRGLFKFIRFGPTELHETRSTFKSVTGLLAGIAIDEGIISLDDRVMPLIARYHELRDTDPRKQRITVRHLLEMTSGLDCSEMPGASPYRETNAELRGNMVRSHSELPMADEPGATWRYCSSNPFLFGVALESALTRDGHGSLKGYLDSRLMEPLAIAGYEPNRSPKGHILMHGGQKLRPRDLTKFGQLILSDGRWQERSVVPADWIVAIRSDGMLTGWSWTSSVVPDPIMQRQSRYRYQWFQTPMRVGKRDLRLVHSWGNGGQFIVAVPELDLVVTTTGSNYGFDKIEKQKQIFHMLYQYILPAAH